MRVGDELDPKRAEIEQLLRRAHIHQVRGEYAKAKELLQQALELSPEDASVWEVLGDYARANGDWQAARDAYKRAHELQPQNAHIERKYAEAVLQVTRLQAQYQQWERALEGKSTEDTLTLPRNPGLAFLLSLIMPGVGQLYNGQFVKGGVILGIMIIGFIVLLTAPGGSDFIHNVLAYLINPARVQGSVGGLQLFVAGVMVLTWVYAFIDAPLSAAARNRTL